MSSASAVDRVKRATRAKRAGHAGTLDPIATGVLAVCLGEATKLAKYLLADDKAYEATGVLGVATDTLDRTGTIIAERPAQIERGQLEAALARRLGAQRQVPPMYSAIKQGGVRLYHRARAGEEVERTPREIRIDELALLAFEPPRFTIALACSKGTYVRSLIADLGDDLGCGAHLAELRRTRSGRFTIDRALALDAALALSTEQLERELVHPADATGLPMFVCDAELARRIRNGAPVPASVLDGCENHVQFQIADGEGRLVALAHTRTGKLVYDRVFRA
jgi:tRNA pseudouridine55 synthase